MELKAGYKQTEVGVIPEDWEAHPLGKVLTLQRGFDLPKRLRRKGSIPIVTSSGIEDFHDQPAVKGPGVVTGRYGTIGNVYFVKDDYWPLNTTLWLRDFHGNEPLWAFRILQTVDFLSHSGKSGVPGVNRNDVHGEIICVPSLPEQRAIATALGDADALIASLDALIAKKRDLKQATMQQLLTGKTRLPGFTGEWEVKTVEDAMDCYDNLRVPLNDAQRSKMKGDIPYCGANGVVGTVNDYVIDDDIILIAEDGGYFDEYRTRPIAYRMVGKCWVNNHAHILKAKEGYDQGFLYYSLVHKDIQAFLASGTRAKLNKSEMWKISTLIPNEPTEQIAIAEVLADIDADLAALEAQRDKARAINQGMMQELLTGRIRLV